MCEVLVDICVNQRTQDVSDSIRLALTDPIRAEISCFILRLRTANMVDRNDMDTSTSQA